jgi:hypothetical protein
VFTAQYALSPYISINRYASSLKGYRGAFVGVMNEKFNPIEMHRIHNVKMSVDVIFGTQAPLNATTITTKT